MKYPDIYMSEKQLKGFLMAIYNVQQGFKEVIAGKGNDGDNENFLMAVESLTSKCKDRALLRPYTEVIISRSDDVMAVSTALDDISSNIIDRRLPVAMEHYPLKDDRTNDIEAPVFELHHENGGGLYINDTKIAQTNVESGADKMWQQVMVSDAPGVIIKDLDPNQSVQKALNDTKMKGDVRKAFGIRASRNMLAINRKIYAGETEKIKLVEAFLADMNTK